MNRSEEQKLIAAAAGGSRAAAEELVKAHQRSLYAYILRLSGKPELAEDVVQEAFVRALTNLDRFDPRFRFSTWVFTIARRVYVNHLQRCRPELNCVAVDEALSDRTGAALRMQRNESATGLRDAIQGALMTLPFVQREVLILFHQHEWPINLIASHLNLPEGTVKSHLHRGRRRLRDVLSADPQMSRAVQEVRT